jgi:hypothetical protein
MSCFGAVIVLSRIVWLITGVLWAGSSAIDFSDANYLEPSTALDWLALASWSAASVCLSASVLLLSRLAPSGAVVNVAIVVAAGGLVAAIANALEDGLGITEMGLFYIIGFAAMWLGLVGLAVTFFQSGYPRLAGVSVALFAGVTLFPVGGAFVILVALCAVAITPSWFSYSRPTPATAYEPAGTTEPE